MPFVAPPPSAVSTGTTVSQPDLLVKDDDRKGNSTVSTGTTVSQPGAAGLHVARSIPPPAGRLDAANLGLDVLALVE
jgi:hypothetical protein